MSRRFVFALALVTCGSGCVVVRSYEREHLAHPSMAAVVDPLEQLSLRKMYQSREAASGGDSLSAGGGCGCSN